MRLKLYIVIRELNINITQKERRRLISDHRQVNYIREIFFRNSKSDEIFSGKIMIFESKFAKKRKVRMKEARYVH